MSADKDRAVRRQKQKRAKDMKKQGKLAPQPAQAKPGAAKTKTA
jgi:hypothetical protein